MSRSLRVLLVALLALAGAAVWVPAAAAGAADCRVTWGSLATTDPAQGTGPLRAVRTGRHACFDRIVFEVDGPVAGWSANYVPVVVQDGSGEPLVVPGGARLQVMLHHPAYDEAGRATYTGPVPVPGFRTLRSVVFGGSFEGYTTFGVGTRARLPYRVFTLPGRIVMDVAHSW